MDEQHYRTKLQCNDNDYVADGRTYDVAVLFWSPDDLANGKYKYHYALSIVKDCFDKKWFPGYDAKAEEGARGVLICSFLIGVRSYFIRWLQMILNSYEKC